MFQRNIPFMPLPFHSIILSQPIPSHLPQPSEEMVYVLVHLGLGLISIQRDTRVFLLSVVGKKKRWDIAGQSWQKSLGHFERQWLIRAELINSYLPNQDKDYFLNRLNYLTLAPLGHHDKSPHFIMRRVSFKDSQLVQ